MAVQVSMTPALTLAEAWDEAASAIEHDPMRPIRYGKCFAYLKSLGRDASVLEIGCGEGTGLMFGTRFGFENLAGCEISPERLRRARTKLDHRVVLEQVDGSGRLPFESCSFDAAYSTAVIEHTLDPKAFLADIARVVKPGGTVVISSDCWQWRVLQVLGIYQSAQPIDRAMLTSTLLRLCADTGFEVLSFDGFPLRGKEFRFLRMLASGIWRNRITRRVSSRLQRLTGWKKNSVPPVDQVRSLEQEYQVFTETIECVNSSKPHIVRYFNSMFSDENVFYLRRR